MTPEQGIAFLEALGSKHVKKNGEWLAGSCPLAPWTHKGGHDTNPSFGLSVAEGKRSRYNCFTCSNGSALDLIQGIEFYHSKNPTGVPDFKLAHQILDSEELLVTQLPGYTEFNSGEYKMFEEWPEYWIQSFLLVASSIVGAEYLTMRGVPVEQWIKFDLRYDAKRQMVVFPYYTVYGKFAGARGRSVLSDVKGHSKHFDYTWNGVNNSSLVWFNEPCLQQDGPVVVVEGQFDALRVLQRYPKCVANLTAKPTAQKLPKLMQSSKVIHIPDNDQAGEASIPLYQRACQLAGVPYCLLQLPVGVKDPDDCSPDYLYDRIMELV